jgi:hypothetical protein
VQIVEQSWLRMVTNEIPSPRIENTSLFILNMTKNSRKSLSAEDVISAHFPIASLALISAITVGVTGMFLKLRDIAREQRKDLESKLTEKVKVSELVEQLKFLIAQQDKKIERLEQIIFRLPINGANSKPS